MDYFSIEEKVMMVKLVFGGNSLRASRDRFAEIFPDRPVPTIRTISSTIAVFEKTGSVVSSKNKAPRDEPEINDLDVQICALVEQNNTLSSREIAKEINCAQSSVVNILRKHKYVSYKISTSQEIYGDDAFRRLQFCEIAINMCNGNDDFLHNILFTDESSFFLHTPHNSQNTRYWSRENLHISLPTRTQHPQKVNVWAGLIGNRVIGPFVLDGNLNGRKYLELLQNRVVPAIRENFDTNVVWFQQDGCPAHNTRVVSNYLNEIFENRWIGTNGPVRWPARSPDLAPNDFFLWPYIKNTVFHHIDERPQNLEELQNRISEVCNNIAPHIFENVRRNFYDRLGYCSAAHGELFEHLIR